MKAIMTNKWRPPDWEGFDYDKFKSLSEDAIFEAGADAMLKAVRIVSMRILLRFPLDEKLELLAEALKREEESKVATGQDYGD